MGQRPAAATRQLVARFATAVLLGVPAAGPVSAQADGTVPIRQLLVDADRDRRPDRTGDTVEVRGVLTSDPLRVGKGAYLANIQDPTAGLVLFARDSALFSMLAQGDTIEAVGVVGSHRGSEQLHVLDVRRFGHAGVPAPLDVLARDLLGPRMSGRLVRLSGELLVARTAEGWLRAELRDRSGTVPVHVSAAWLSDAGFVRDLDAGGTVEITGIAGQAGPTRVEGGHALVPRDRGDFHFPVRPPYSAIAAVSLVALAFVLNGWRLREARRAHELARLTGELEASRDALAAREQRFRSLVEHSADTVSILDADGRVVYQSPSVTANFGWQAEELVGTSIVDLIHPEDRDLLEGALDGGTGGTGTATVQLRLRARSGDWRFVEAKLRDRSRDPAVEGIVCNIRDITAHRELELRLRQADRMEAVGRLTGGIAHDFNNILTAITGHSEFAMGGLATDHPAREEVKEIGRAADRATSLVRQLLAFSSQQVLNPQVLVPSDAIRSLEPMLRRVIGEDVELIVSAPADLSSVQVDRTQLEQVIMNLVVNARDAMPDGGAVRVTVEDDPITPVTAAASSYPVSPGEYVRISVSDTGAGMDEDTQKHIFEPFFTTKGPARGTGLGLATVYGIVKQSGGYIEVRSQVGRGTTFDIWLPRSEASPAPPTPTDAVPGLETGNGAAVLVVEDEAGVRRLATRILERHGYRVLAADGPREALALASGLTELDLLVTDVIMPDMTGRELARRLLEDRPGLPTVFMSGYTQDEVIHRGGVDCSGDRFLQKPFTADQLLGAVAAVLGARCC